MKNRSLWLIDLVGTLLVSAIVVGVGWYVFAKPDTASRQLFTLIAEVEQLQNENLQLQGMLDVQTAHHQKLLASAEDLGRLPDESPIDQNLKKIAALATDHHIKVLEVAPVSTLRYPSVLELRYEIKTEGSFADQVGFLRSYEASSFWSDMTFLTMAQDPTAPVEANKNRARQEAANATRRGQYTVSFFSSYQ